MNKFLIVFMAIITSVLLFSCEKKQLGYFVVTGYNYSYDSLPHINKHVYVHLRYIGYPLDNKNSMSQIVGEAYTDSVGFFEIVCEYYNKRGDYTSNLTHNNINATLGEIINLDTLYTD